MHAGVIVKGNGTTGLQKEDAETEIWAFIHRHAACRRVGDKWGVFPFLFCYGWRHPEVFTLQGLHLHGDGDGQGRGREESDLQSYTSVHPLSNRKGVGHGFTEQCWSKLKAYSCSTTTF